MNECVYNVFEMNSFSSRNQHYQYTKWDTCCLRLLLFGVCAGIAWTESMWMGNGDVEFVSTYIHISELKLKLKLNIKIRRKTIYAESPLTPTSICDEKKILFKNFMFFFLVSDLLCITTWTYKYNTVYGLHCTTSSTILVAGK